MKKDAKNSNSFEKDYNNLFKKVSENTFNITVKEWKKNGDYFEKFSMYNYNISSVTSSKTTITSNNIK